MKKFLVFFCVFAIFLSGAAVHAQPQSEITVTAQIIRYGSSEQAVSNGSYDRSFGGLDQGQIDQLKNAIFDCLYNMKPSVDVTRFGFYLYKDSSGNLYTDQNIINVYSEVVATYPYLFNSQNFEVRANATTHRISTIFPKYNVLGEEFQREVDYCKAEIKRITELIPKELSDAEKVVFVQDYLAINFGYDTRIFSANTAIRDQTVYDMYGFFTEKVGVCQAYTSTFNAIMDELGLHSESVIDRTDNHIWNVVEIDGENYHLDCTHDDPLFATSQTSGRYDFKGLVKRTCLLLNDTEMAIVAGPTEWHTPLSLSDVVCDSNRFSNASFRNIDTPLSYYNGYWYGAEAALPTTIYKVSRDFTTEEPIYTLDPNYTGNLDGIKGSLLIGNCLYINSLFEVIRLNLDTFEVATLYTSNEQISTVYYYGDGYIGVVKGYDFANSADNKFRLKIGDVNCDNYINALDLIPIMNYIVGVHDNTFSRTLSDANLDGNVNLIDLIRIKKYLVGMIPQI